MLCPNCNTAFMLRSDYAAHVSSCRPEDDPAVTDELLARLNAAAARLQADFGAIERDRPLAPDLVPAA